MAGRKTKSLSDLLKPGFNVESMGTGLKRGMVLRITPAKILDVLKSPGFKNDLKNIKLKGPDENPILCIYMKAGSPWRVQIHQQRYQIKKKINERLKQEFIRDVRVY